MTEHTNTSARKTLRCAVYTRKSHEEGLEQEFNSLDAQREAGEAYVESQRMQGWRLLPERYDDGGFSGGSTDRPALQRLLADVEAGKIDIIVVYKIDRLSRSLLDFIKMIELFSARGVSFVSVTQQISTTDSHGRMMLNILMTFAQYEREIIAERIRDKVAAAKRRGKYCGGVPILGYDVDQEKRRLKINPEEARLVQFIFRRFSQLGSAKRLAQELNEQGYRTKAWTTRKGKARTGAEWNIAHIYRVLNNRIYLGEVTHKGTNYPGEHEALIEQGAWVKAHAILKGNAPVKEAAPRSKMVAPLKGVIRCGHCGGAMGPTYTRKGGRFYTYYLCEKDAKRAVSACPVRRVPAGDIERAVAEQLAAVFRSPTLVAQTWRAAREIESAERERLAARKERLERELAEARRQALGLIAPGGNSPKRGEALARLNQQADELAGQLRLVAEESQVYEAAPIGEREIAESFQSVDAFWEDLFPAERHRLVRLLVEKVELRETGIDMVLKTGGLGSLVSELAGLACQMNERRTHP